MSSPAHDTARLTEAFRRAVLRLFVRLELFDAEQVSGTRTRPHSWFQVLTAVWSPDEDRAFATRLSRECAPNPIAPVRLSCDRSADVDAMMPGIVETPRGKTRFWTTYFAARQQLHDTFDRTRVLRALDRDEEALDEFRSKGKLLDQPLAGLAMSYAKMGRRSEAMQVIRAMEARTKTQWVEPTFIAMSYAALDDRDAAMRWLERAYESRTFAFRSFTSWDHPWLRPL